MNTDDGKETALERVQVTGSDGNHLVRSLKAPGSDFCAEENEACPVVVRLFVSFVNFCSMDRISNSVERRSPLCASVDSVFKGISGHRSVGRSASSSTSWVRT